MRKHVLCSLILAGLTAWSTEASAQAPGRLSFDLSIGRGFGDSDGIYRGNDSGMTGDVLAALRVSPLAGGGLVAALGAGIQGTGAVTSVCIPTAPGVCMPDYPDFALFSVLLGWETPGGGFRGLVGPAAVHDEATAAGIAGRMDLSTRLLGPVWLLASARGLVVPDYAGDSFRFGSVGIGFRIR